MNLYTYSEARQKLASVLNEAKRDGQVIIKRKDGTIFKITPDTPQKSPLDVKGVKTNITKKEILSVLREIREG
ncbi:type II toxin-antitoxin system prevent-host-death family antitoxin [Candidatus Poribacteria bacterium]|nr:type II toxin-antitoxin system prevent-host-death family antitoxin [Candidatus Poribacteria bacterium]